MSLIDLQRLTFLSAMLILR